MFILCLLILSVGAGIMLRRVRGIGKIEKTAGWTIYLLLFVFGITIGGNSDIVAHFASLGMMAFVVAAAGVAGSVLFAWILYRASVKKGGRS